MVMKADRKVITRNDILKNDKFEFVRKQDKTRRIDEMIDKMAERHRLRESLNREFESTMKNAEKRCNEEERLKGLRACEERIIAEFQAKGEW